MSRRDNKLRKSLPLIVFGAVVSSTTPKTIERLNFKVAAVDAELPERGC